MFSLECMGDDCCRGYDRDYEEYTYPNQDSLYNVFLNDILHFDRLSVNKKIKGGQSLLYLYRLVILTESDVAW